MAREDGHKMLQDWAIAFEQKSPDALAALYSRQALFFGSTPALVQGRDGVRAYFANALPSVDAKVAFADVEMIVDADQIHIAGICRVAFSDGSSIGARMTQSLRREPEGWRIICHHASPLVPQYG